MEVVDISNRFVNYNTSQRNFAKLFTHHERHLYQLVNFYVITSAISLFGIGANVMNIIVFYKQGFNTTTNISFFGLAISDLCSLITLLWFNMAMSGFLVNMGVSMATSEVAYLAAGHPHICFARITSWITVFITAERCLCITLPLKIKQLITPRRTTVILCSIYLLIMLSFEPEFQTAYVGWRFEKNRNKTILGILFTSDRKSLDGLAFILYAILGFASFITVIVFTLILVIQLNKQSKWRKNEHLEKGRSSSISNRERKTMTMVVMIASILIVCYAPGVAVSSVSFFEPEFSVLGAYVNAFFSVWSFVFVFEAFNSSVNIFLYYYMSTKYRETFHLFFCRYQASRK